ncbi:MAG TPA: hypothetical protein VNM40_03685 [Candidatus Paceibacterota bacterium]|nr:hypothetical protein [Candidatus Paceibacterota bacterium]
MIRTMNRIIADAGCVRDRLRTLVGGDGEAPDAETIPDTTSVAELIAKFKERHPNYEKTQKRHGVFSRLIEGLPWANMRTVGDIRIRISEYGRPDRSHRRFQHGWNWANVGLQSRHTMADILDEFNI